MLVVLDTNVVVAALRNPGGASGWLVRHGIRQRSVVVSVPLMFEYEDVGTRPALLSETGLTLREVQATLGEICLAARQIQPTFSWRPALPNPNDDMVLETAIGGGAGVVVTFNVRDFDGAERFGVKVERPA